MSLEKSWEILFWVKENIYPFAYKFVFLSLSFLFEVGLQTFDIANL